MCRLACGSNSDGSIGQILILSVILGFYQSKILPISQIRHFIGHFWHSISQTRRSISQIVLLWVKFTFYQSNSLFISQIIILSVKIVFYRSIFHCIGQIQILSRAY